MSAAPFTPADLIDVGSRLEAMAAFPPGAPVPASEVARWGRMMMGAARQIAELQSQVDQLRKGTGHGHQS